ncbi:acylphosphatase, partial [Acinetobacter baumannii]
MRGRVQGVGFRPMVWRHARELGLLGHVLNDAEGVLIRASGKSYAILELIARLENEPPPLALVESVEVALFDGLLDEGF